MNLRNIGLNDYFNNQVSENENVGRVTKSYQQKFTFITSEGEETGEITGKMQFEEHHPKVGDFVLYKKSEDKSFNSIYKILDRKSCLSRKEAGLTSNEQILASNIDYVFIVMSLNFDFNLRRIERYLIAAWESGAEPVVILTKADICEDLTEKMELIKSVTVGVEVLSVSAITGFGMDEINKYNTSGSTIALVGSSGVGKSTLINTLAGKEIMDTGDIRIDDSKGKHTTTHREMIIIQDGACLIDTPGMREFTVFNGEVGVEQEFQDIIEISNTCKFSDCKHIDEPGCMISKKLINGELDRKRYDSYINLKKEISHQERKRKKQEQISAKKSSKSKRKSTPRVKRWAVE